ncbi:ATP-binding cassette domain-containing protein, partial [Burkholderia contaminans]|uniref:ATP-binding cassette domain-containing protein n=1 Tax=Burkholderia contaminans TaxID=488447 RepID=UPI002D800A30
MTEPLLTMRGIVKAFDGVKALDGIDLTVRPGECVGLCGENGAGKSTLMKIISGQYLPDDGVVHYRGAPVRFRSASEAQAAGISIIHQELNLVPHLSVAENLFLAREPRRGPFVDTKRM